MGGGGCESKWWWLVVEVVTVCIVVEVARLRWRRACERPQKSDVVFTE